MVKRRCWVRFVNAKTESDGDVCRVLVSSSAINLNRNHSARRVTVRATHPYCPGGKPVVVRDPSIIPLTTATWGVQCSGVPIPRLRFARRDCFENLAASEARIDRPNLPTLGGRTLLPVSNATSMISDRWSLPSLSVAPVSIQSTITNACTCVKVCLCV